MKSILTIEGLTRSFYGVDVLRGVSLSVRQGTITGLIGPNGAGKSTLFNVVSGLYRADSGRIAFDTRDITDKAPHELVAAGLVRTFQLARGFPKLSVYQHLMLYGRDQPGDGLFAALMARQSARAREKALSERAVAIARRLNLDHVLDNPVTALSGGQKKLLEIGRALMSEPSMMLLDEPMAGVNPTLAADIAKHLVALNNDGITILLIAHDMALVRRLCDPVIVMTEGKTLTEGSFADVAIDARVQEAYLGRRH